MNPEQARFLAEYFAKLMEGEFPATCSVIEAVPDAQRDYKPDEKSRSAWELTTHLALGDIWFLDSIIGGAFVFDPAVEKAQREKLNNISGVAAFYRQAFPERMQTLRQMSDEHLTRSTIGCPLEGVTVHVTSADGTVERRVNTSADGTFRVEGVSYGHSHVTAELRGFEAARGTVDVRGQGGVWDASLNVGQLGATAYHRVMRPTSVGSATGACPARNIPKSGPKAHVRTMRTSSVSAWKYSWETAGVGSAKVSRKQKALAGCCPARA